MTIGRGKRLTYHGEWGCGVANILLVAELKITSNMVTVVHKVHRDESCRGPITGRLPGYGPEEVYECLRDHCPRPHGAKGIHYVRFFITSDEKADNSIYNAAVGRIPMQDTLDNECNSGKKCYHWLILAFTSLEKIIRI